MNLDTVIFPQHEMAYSKWSTEPFLSIDASRARAIMYSIGKSHRVLNFVKADAAQLRLLFFCQRHLKSALPFLLGAP